MAKSKYISFEEFKSKIERIFPQFNWFFDDITNFWGKGGYLEIKYSLGIWTIYVHDEAGITSSSDSLQEVKKRLYLT
jgi:hypothetical protein